jgi:hypothetical protein
MFGSYVELFFNNICTCPHDMPSMCTEPNRLFTTRDGVNWEALPVGSAEEQLGHGTGAAAYDMVRTAAQAQQHAYTLHRVQQNRLPC